MHDLTITTKKKKLEDLHNILKLAAYKIFIKKKFLSKTQKYAKWSSAASAGRHRLLILLMRRLFGLSQINCVIFPQSVLCVWASVSV